MPFQEGQIYEGPERFCFAVDIGTTQSAASYVHLQPNSPPQVKVVQKWPFAGHSFKIPSNAFYSREGELICLGAETEDEEMIEKAAEEGWDMARWWKVHAHSPTRLPAPRDTTFDPSSSSSDEPISLAPRLDAPPLPPNTTVVQIYRDFLNYLFKHTKAYFFNHSSLGAEGENDADNDGNATQSRWDDVLFPNLFVVIAHPNSWDVAEQELLREAVRSAEELGFCSAGDGSDAAVERSLRERLFFVREAEASFHFVQHYYGNERWLQEGNVFTVCDCGGSTVDTTQYQVLSTGFPPVPTALSNYPSHSKPKSRSGSSILLPNQTSSDPSNLTRTGAGTPPRSTSDSNRTINLTEVQSSSCIQAGGVYVSLAFNNIAQARLSNSEEFNNSETLSALVREFEGRVKVRFGDGELEIGGVANEDGKGKDRLEEGEWKIRFGRDRDCEKAVGIWKGRMRFEGSEIIKAFDTCVPEILSALSKQVRFHDHVSSHILLVGGFGESPYLLKKVKETFQPQGIQIISAEEPSKKAVAEGAGLWFAHRLVVARAIRAYYGLESMRVYDPSNEDHVKRMREGGLITRPNGGQRLANAWTQLVEKDIILPDQAEVTHTFSQQVRKIEELSRFRCHLYTFEPETISLMDEELDESSGYGRPGNWIKRVDGRTLNPGFRKVCTLQADLSGLIRMEASLSNETASSTTVVPELRSSPMELSPSPTLLSGPMRHDRSGSTSGLGGGYDSNSSSPMTTTPPSGLSVSPAGMERSNIRPGPTTPTPGPHHQRRQSTFNGHSPIRSGYGTGSRPGSRGESSVATGRPLALGSAGASGGPSSRGEEEHSGRPLPPPPSTSRLSSGGRTPGMAIKQRGPKSEYWFVEFQVAIRFQTKLSARLVWFENGELREGPMEIIPDAMR